MILEGIGIVVTFIGIIALFNNMTVGIFVLVIGIVITLISDDDIPFWHWGDDEDDFN